MYINDVLKNIKKLKIGCTLNYEKLNIIAFADDIFLLAPSLKGLQTMTDEILQYFNNIKLSVNVDKSKYLVFKRKKNINFANTLKLDNMQIERVSNLKYLGVFLNENLDLASRVGNPDIGIGILSGLDPTFPDRNFGIGNFSGSHSRPS